MVQSLETMRVEVDLAAIVANARDVKALVGPAKGVLAVLKADAYGHGLVQVARALERDQVVAGLVVTSLASALALRREGVELPVVALLGQYGRAHGAVLEAGLTPVLASTADLEPFARAARTRGTRVAVHVEIDTGMSRLGIREDELAPFLSGLAAHPEITISGLCTQLASADSESTDGAHRQLDLFERARDSLRLRRPPADDGARGEYGGDVSPAAVPLHPRSRGDRALWRRRAERRSAPPHDAPRDTGRAAPVDQGRRDRFVRRGVEGPAPVANRDLAGRVRSGIPAQALGTRRGAHSRTPLPNRRIDLHGNDDGGCHRPR